jgi:hypothetical protein
MIKCKRIHPAKSKFCSNYSVDKYLEEHLTRRFEYDIVSMETLCNIRTEAYMLLESLKVKGVIDIVPSIAISVGPSIRISRDSSYFTHLN